MRIASATASHISLAISRMQYVQSNAQHCPAEYFPPKHICKVSGGASFVWLGGGGRGGAKVNMGGPTPTFIIHIILME